MSGEGNATILGKQPMVEYFSRTPSSNQPPMSTESNIKRRRETRIGNIIRAD
jgi:hypothetical protein